MSQDTTTRSEEAQVTVRFDDRGLPGGATAEVVAQAPIAEVWEIVRDVERYPERVPMISKARRTIRPGGGERLQMQLKFRIALFSAKFGFVADVTEHEPSWIEVSYISGEPGDLHIRFELEPVDDGRATRIRAAIGFDIRTLGWLVKVFLRHHPEIQYGVFPGSALVLVDSLRRIAEGRPPPGKE